MSDLLAFEADRRAVNITINRCCPFSELAFSYYLSRSGGFENSIVTFLCTVLRGLFLCSIGTELTRDDRRKLYSSFGLL